MRRLIYPITVLLILGFGAAAQHRSDDSGELTALLKEFLAGASRNDAAMHDRFWAEDLIYTGSSGRRIGKADIIREARATPATTRPAQPTTYGAEDIRIQQYGDTAIVAFRLTATTVRNGKTSIAQFLNTGTFLKRNGMWQAVAWQATKMPEAQDELRKEIADLDAGFHRALLTADISSLESITDETLVWTHSNGDRWTRERLLDNLKSGQLKYSKLETSDVAVSVYGDTAIVRGKSLRQRISIPGAASGPDPSPLTIFYTLTFINKGTDWKLAAVHSSRG
ncbi:MAG TPA: nuclear transport factor 2 family protein [Blastocatellia bacterium]|nr:nuclear transport factor 2 family protein [Blastocatellia bacterium]